MTPERYNKVKEIFLAACDKPREEQGQFIEKSCQGDEEIRREVESLLKEHRRDTQVMPSQPEGPLGSMSAILSRANIDIADEMRSSPVSPLNGSGPVEVGIPQEGSSFHEESGQSTSSGIVDAGRFPAGTVAAGRYRIIEMLGRGGMGEVYRADDLTLNQSVALKFLPAIFCADQKWLERFRTEVRLARQVTHPNVCRVFDIAEYHGEQFISMEYVDGENLGSLLRRIGRLSHDKAVQIARQLCAGLAAAHDRGVLHRDLKPANVMIDGRGSVRITDFGLAAPTDQLRTDGVRAGTPAYMSPEQLAGKPVTVRSDVYSLGLVLYEMFTGRRAFRAESLRDYKKLHSTEDPTPPSDIIEDMDPIVERVILKCLEKDPKQRPAGPMAVSAALPGGNPLREILAAGEIPSPEVVAAAGEAHRSIRIYLAVILLVVAVASLIVFVVLAPRTFIVQRALDHPESHPAVLAEQARNILKDLGYTGTPRDSAQGFAVSNSYYLRVQDQRDPRVRHKLVERARPGLFYFWYRQSPELLVPRQPDSPVREHDPSPPPTGSVCVRLDPLGRLIGLEVTRAGLPGSSAAGTEPAAEAPDWTATLRHASQMDKGSFKPVDPSDTPPVYGDQRFAWDGTFEDAPDEPVHIEAAVDHGQPVYFAVIGKWKQEQLSESRAQQLSMGLSNTLILTVVSLLLILAGTWLAWKNHRSGRGDRQGATRMALAFFLLGLVSWLLRTHHVPDLVSEFTLFQRGMGPVLYLTSLIWIFYMALEPYVRRVWPETVISWSRLLAGKWFDPLVGRDVLAGAALGVTARLLTLIEYELPRGLSLQAPIPSVTALNLMLGSTTSLSSLFSGAIIALYEGLLLLLFLVLVRMLAKRQWIVGTLFVLLFATATAHYNAEAWWELHTENYLSWGVQCILGLLFLGLIMRHGLVAIIFCILVHGLLADFPVSWDFSAWYATNNIVAMAAVGTILVASFYAAVGGTPVGLRPAET